MRNLEFKARLGDPNAVLIKARSLGADLWGDLRQTDTYFQVSRGRLKLRETAGLQAELVYYERDEKAEARLCDYQVAATPDSRALKWILTKTLGVVTVVRKRRTLLLLDTTRIHLDNVDGLGRFLEFEVPAKDGDQAAAAKGLALLMMEFGFVPEDGIRASYADLILAAESS